MVVRLPLFTEWLSFMMGLGGELMYSVDGMSSENLHSLVSAMIKGDILCWHCTVCLSLVILSLEETAH